MATETNDILTIGYAGSLMDARPGDDHMPTSFFRENFWTFRNVQVDFTTRSGYYLFEGLAHLKKTNPGIASKIRLRIWGNIAPGNMDFVKEFGLEKEVKIEGYCSKSETHERYAQCDVLFFPLESSREIKPLWIPGKLYEYLKIGKPILALAEDSDAVHILQKSGLGLSVDPKDSEKIAEALVYLVAHKIDLPSLFIKDEAYLKRNFDFEVLTAKLASLFDEVLEKKTI